MTSEICEPFVSIDASDLEAVQGGAGAGASPAPMPVQRKGINVDPQWSPRKSLGIVMPKDWKLEWQPGRPIASDLRLL